LQRSRTNTSGNISPLFLRLIENKTDRLGSPRKSKLHDVRMILCTFHKADVEYLDLSYAY
ncbi:BgTH12-02372, partial [Blumeria graminis f. sp. triticale]